RGTVRGQCSVTTEWSQCLSGALRSILSAFQRSGVCRYTPLAVSGRRKSPEEFHQFPRGVCASTGLCLEFSQRCRCGLPGRARTDRVPLTLAETGDAVEHSTCAMRSHHERYPLEIPVLVHPGILAEAVQGCLGLSRAAHSAQEVRRVLCMGLIDPDSPETL